MIALDKCIAFSYTTIERGDNVPLSEKKKASNMAWDSKNLKRLSLALRLDLYERMKNHVDGQKESVNGFISSAVAEKLAREEDQQSSQ